MPGENAQSRGSAAVLSGTGGGADFVKAARWPQILKCNLQPFCPALLLFQGLGLKLVSVFSSFSRLLATAVIIVACLECDSVYQYVCLMPSKHAFLWSYGSCPSLSESAGAAPRKGNLGARMRRPERAVCLSCQEISLCRSSDITRRPV